MVRVKTVVMILLNAKRNLIPEVFIDNSA